MPQERVITTYGIIIRYCYYNAFFHTKLLLLQRYADVDRIQPTQNLRT